jgi:D-3-phosphoglycerate dehydrogenase
MFRLATFNQISPKGLSRFDRDRYQVGADVDDPHAILLRSHQLAPAEIGPSVLAIARAGAGVNNVPVTACTERGIPVFNTPGANANAVKELVLAGMLLASRGILPGMVFLREVDASLDVSLDKAALNTLLEKEKARFRGRELAGKTLGVIGLGAIGSMVADTALKLGMQVLGHDPALSVEAAWRLPSSVHKIDKLSLLMARSDYVTVHVPVLEQTRGLLGADLLRHARPGLCLLNFAREEVVVAEAVTAALDDGLLSRYVTDFPVPSLLGRTDVILLPHLGASTDEAEENCAVMAADQLRDFLENGNILNSVNFPALSLERSGTARLAIANRNVPGMLGQLLSALADEGINVVDMLNRSRDDVAYNLIDLETVPPPSLLSAMRQIEGVISVRLLT